MRAGAWLASLARLSSTLIRARPAETQRGAEARFSLANCGSKEVEPSIRLRDGRLTQATAERIASRILACESAWNKDPVFGVIGIQSGRPERRVHSGFHGGGGSQVGMLVVETIAKIRRAFFAQIAIALAARFCCRAM
jgi:hypothetical protein